MIEFVKPDPYPVDPAVRRLDERQVCADIAAYEALLESESSEEAVHQFLAQHSYFFNNILRLFGYSPLYSKVKLGAEHVTDFAWFDSGSFGPEWRLLEIEAPKERMFTAKGEPTSALNHAIQQVRDWNAWLHENLDYARKLMPQITQPLGYVAIGRRRDLTPETREKLRRLSHDHRQLTEIHTLDFFVTNALSVLELLNHGQGGSWPVPMVALSHADLAAGLPTWSHEWLNNGRTTALAEEYAQMRLNERPHYTADFE